MTLLTREQILNAVDMKTETINVPEWGGEVKVRTLSGAERDDFESGFLGDKVEKVNGEDKATLRREGYKNVRARLVSWTVVNDSGVNIFTEADIEALGKKNAAALDRVFEVAQRLSGLTKKDISKLASDAAKN